MGSSLFANDAQMLERTGLSAGPKKYTIKEAIEKVTDKKRLKIDDLLPLFPPDEKVQDMKDQLCNCLSDYKKTIDELKTNLASLSDNSEVLRNLQRKQKHKHITISPNQTCELCFKAIFEKEFYVFPCQHAFHRQCIYNKLENYSTRNDAIREQVNRLKSLFSQIRAIDQKQQELLNDRASE